MKITRPLMDAGRNEEVESHKALLVTSRLSSGSISQSPRLWLRSILPHVADVGDALSMRGNHIGIGLLSTQALTFTLAILRQYT
jgi:hypothetical protein